MDQKVSSVIRHYSIYELDNTVPTCNKIEISEQSQNELQKFLRRMAADTRSSKSTRKCQFDSDSYIKPIIEKLLSGSNEDEDCQKLANYLANCEFKMNQRISGLNQNIKKGSLIVTRITIAQEELLLITKIDIEEFFENKTMRLEKGLPKEKGLLKSCLISIVDNKIDDPFSIADSNGKISSFWSSNFIGAKFYRDDKQNTESAVAAIIGVLAPIHKASPEDHTELRQNLFSYLKTNDSYNHEDMVNAVIGDFTPNNKNVNTEEIKARLFDLLTLDKFDGTFTLDKETVKKKSKKVYKFDNDVVLNVNNGNTSNIYKTKIENDHYVLIKTSSGYADFQELKSKKLN